MMASMWLKLAALIIISIFTILLWSFSKCNTVIFFLQQSQLLNHFQDMFRNCGSVTRDVIDWGNTGNIHPWKWCQENTYSWRDTNFESNQYWSYVQQYMKHPHALHNIRDSSSIEMHIDILCRQHRKREDLQCGM